MQKEICMVLICRKYATIDETENLEEKIIEMENELTTLNVDKYEVDYIEVDGECY